jgi:type I restriction enzyme, S subunit
MKQKWPSVKLGDVLYLDLHKVPIDPSVTYSMVGVLSFGKGLFDKEPIDNGNTSYKYFLKLKENHFVMSQLFGWEGALATSDNHFSGKYVSPQFPTFVCDDSKLNLQFLKWNAATKLFWDELATRTNGMGDRRRTLNPAALYECRISLPPLDVQKNIVARIDSVQQQLQAAEKLRKSVTLELQAICRSLMVNDHSTKQIQVAELVKQRPPDVSVEPDVSYQFAGVYSFGRGVFKGVVKTGAEFAYPKLSRIKPGDFIYPKLMAWEGALGVVPDECDSCVVSPEFPVFEIDKTKVLPDVFDVYFRDPSTWESLQSGSTGTNARRRRLNPADFLKLKIPVPSMATQQKLSAIRLHQKQIQGIEAGEESSAVMASVLNKMLA